MFPWDRFEQRGDVWGFGQGPVLTRGPQTRGWAAFRTRGLGEKGDCSSFPHRTPLQRLHQRRRR